MILSLIVVAVAMGVNDILCTLVVVAEARGRALLAGGLDAASDLARMIYLALGIEALAHGFSGRAVATLAVICATSFVATSATTRWARGMKEAA